MLSVDISPPSETELTLLFPDDPVPVLFYIFPGLSLFIRIPQESSFEFRCATICRKPLPFPVSPAAIISNCFLRKLYLSESSPNIAQIISFSCQNAPWLQYTWDSADVLYRILHICWPLMSPRPSLNPNSILGLFPSLYPSATVCTTRFLPLAQVLQAHCSLCSEGHSPRPRLPSAFSPRSSQLECHFLRDVPYQNSSLQPFYDS